MTKFANKFETIIVGVVFASSILCDPLPIFGLPSTLNRSDQMESQIHVKSPESKDQPHSLQKSGPFTLISGLVSQA